MSAPASQLASSLPKSLINSSPPNLQWILHLSFQIPLQNVNVEPRYMDHHLNLLTIFVRLLKMIALV